MWGGGAQCAHMACFTEHLALLDPSSCWAPWPAGCLLCMHSMLLFQHASHPSAQGLTNSALPPQQPAFLPTRPLTRLLSYLPAHCLQACSLSYGT